MTIRSRFHRFSFLSDVENTISSQLFLSSDCKHLSVPSSVMSPEPQVYGLQFGCVNRDGLFLVSCSLHFDTLWISVMILKSLGLF